MKQNSEVDAWLEKLKIDKEILEERELGKLCRRVKDILAEESNVQPVRAPVQVCGDLHGQFYDLLELFRKGGEMPLSNYIFIGDFVDRGYNSVETIEYLFCLKMRYPNQITLLRGNHESRQVTSTYGFYDEIQRKYGNSIPWNLFMDVFDHLPLAALIEGSILCIHGGLSPDIKTIDQIRTIVRKQEIPTEGGYADLMWSDPDDVDDWASSPRGAGWLFGANPTNKFSQINGLDLTCRAHQLAEEGFKYWFANKNLVTVWSAPNYCYRMQNAASILSFDEKLLRQFTIFHEVPESSRATNSSQVLPYFL